MVYLMYNVEVLCFVDMELLPQTAYCVVEVQALDEVRGRSRQVWLEVWAEVFSFWVKVLEEKLALKKHPGTRNFNFIIEHGESRKAQ